MSVHDEENPMDIDEENSNSDANRWSALRMNNLANLNDYIFILEEIGIHMEMVLMLLASVVAFLVACIHRGLYAVGEQVQLLGIFINELLVWMQCYGELTMLTIEDHVYVIQCQSRFEPKTRQTIASLEQNEARDLTGFTKEQLQML
jgi:hypothetical protein